MSDSQDDLCYQCQAYLYDCECMLMAQKQSLTTIYTVDQIFDILMADVHDLQQTLNLDQDQVLLLMEQYKWNQENILNNYYEPLQETKREQEQYQQQQRLAQQLKINQSEQECRVCLDDNSHFIVMSTCGHRCCHDCFQQYISSSLSSPLQGLIPCLEQCGSKIPFSTCLELLPPDQALRYKKALAQIYILKKKKIKFCPGADCPYAIENEDYLTQEVECKCGLEFCFSCLEHNHVPASCDQVHKWNLKNKNESQNIAWIQSHTKMCPNCQQPIEKNQGCNHMTCTLCGHHFCWICRYEWGNQHDSYYKCNSSRGVNQDELQSKSKAYLYKLHCFYFERYNNHQKSEGAVPALKKSLDQQITLLHGQQQLNLAEVEFINLSLDVLSKCRRLLKWSYAQGYFLKVDGKVNMQMFEFNQHQVENRCERLHGLLEKDLLDSLCHYPSSSFYQTKQQVVDLTAFSQQFLEQFLKECRDL